jgi:hypothetical protein
VISIAKFKVPCALNSFHEGVKLHVPSGRLLDIELDHVCETNLFLFRNMDVIYFDLLLHRFIKDELKTMQAFLQVA